MEMEEVQSTELDVKRTEILNKPNSRFCFCEANGLTKAHLPTLFWDRRVTITFVFLWQFYKEFEYEQGGGDICKARI